MKVQICGQPLGHLESFWSQARICSMWPPWPHPGHHTLSPVTLRPQTQQRGVRLDDELEKTKPVFSLLSSRRGWSVPITERLQEGGH